MASSSKDTPEDGAMLKSTARPDSTGSRGLTRRGRDGTASNRAATARPSKEEMNKRMHQREAATAAQHPGAAAAHLTIAEAREAAQMMMQQGDGKTPIMVGITWKDDWTRVGDRDEEMRLRDSRHRMMRQFFIDGCYVRYKSSGNSMWPLVHSNDLCTFHPVQAVTAVKEASEIGVGDIVFCCVQRSQHFYAHIVLEIQHDVHAQEPKYWIGNIEQKKNGWCFREHIYGILVQVQVEREGQHYVRPLPKSVYEQVRKLVKDNRWSTVAKRMCSPRRTATVAEEIRFFFYYRGRPGHYELQPPRTSKKTPCWNPS